MAPTTRSSDRIFNPTNIDSDSLFATMRAERAENERLAREDPAAFTAKIRATLPWKHCAMCRVQFKGYGNNAQPILDGYVCDDCNVAVVRQRMCA